MVVALGFLGYGVKEAYTVELKEYTYINADVPSAFDGTRIVLLTDIHRTFYFSEGRVRELVDRVNALEPDLVLLGGDYVLGSADYEFSAFKELARLKAPLGRFAVLGNHDYKERRADDPGDKKDPSVAITAIERSGIELLDNRAVWIERAGARFRLGGISDTTEGDPRLMPTLVGTTAKDLVLLLSHNPDFAEDLSAGEVDLMLSGHTHGGQVTFFGLWAPRLPSDYGQKYLTGMIESEEATVIVSNGIGSIFPPVRFFAPPQIVEITLRSGAATRP